MAAHERVRSAYLSFKRALGDNRFLDYWWLAEQEAATWDSWVDLPLRTRLWLWRHGFVSPLGELYDFETHGRELFLSDLEMYRLCRTLNGRHRYLLDDKLSQHWMLAEYPQNRPVAYGFVDRGRVHGVAGTEFAGHEASVAEWLPTMLRRTSKLVLKDLRGVGGKQVVVCEYDDGYVFDGDRVSEQELIENASSLSGYLVSEFVGQHAYADELFPNATNTIRYLTLWDDETDELLAPAAAHRIGTHRSRPVDNFSSGGLAANIDLETGTLGRAARLPANGTVRWYDVHPDSGARIAGIRIPGWEAVRSTVERLARENTHIPLIAWDILLDESGEPIVIETNTGPGLRLHQVHRPLLSDHRVASVVARYLPAVRNRLPARGPGGSDGGARAR